MRKYIDPTVRDLRAICKSLNIDLNVIIWRIYNDRRGENGRRIKLPMKLTFNQMSLIERELTKKFPAHKFAIGNIMWNCHYFRDSRKVVTAIHIFRDNELYDELFPEPKEVFLTLDAIAKQFNVDPSQLRIVS